jgi:hypothetical protein
MIGLFLGFIPMKVWLLVIAAIGAAIYFGYISLDMIPGIGPMLAGSKKEEEEKDGFCGGSCAI